MVKVRDREPAKGADRPEPKGHAGRIVDWNPRRRWHQDPPDYRTQPPHPLLHIEQQGKPNPSRLPEGGGIPTARKEMAEGVEDAGESEGSAVMAETGPRERRYPARKGADFRRVSAER